MIRKLACALCVAGAALHAAAPAPEPGRMTFESDTHAQCRFEAELGRRIAANQDHWLVPAPDANPALLEMFRLRDRQPPPQLVPWAGEFVGKYLLAAIPALQFDDSPLLRAQVSTVVAQLLECQAEDGYLGPFPQADRLLKNWDLWGHYHLLLALLRWHDATGDTAALHAARRIADLACRVYLDTGRRVFDAGDHEMNMAFLHGLGELCRVAPEDRYRQLMRDIEQDWERAGDYLRTGLNGLEFYETPRPRWESLHDLQGLLVQYRLTGDPRYRDAFTHHWRSIQRFDRRNTGGFSSGEQATGNPYAPTAIETCCTVAWMALTLDMLRLTGEAPAADEFELSLLNAAAGAQHPSGRWWTYNTPMDGTREASAHTIVFQARAGSPELNCCSVNGPRALAFLADWAVMTTTNGLVVNSYAPAEIQTHLPSGPAVTLRTEGRYPVDPEVRLRLTLDTPTAFALHLRIPSWSLGTEVTLSRGTAPPATSGQYLVIDRRWEPGDEITLKFDFRLRTIPGDRETLGRISLYRGPILLAYDQALNASDDNPLPPLDLPRLLVASRTFPPPVGQHPSNPARSPWLLMELPIQGDRWLRVCDFASAGAAGTRYRSWLAANRMPPPSPVSREPRDGQTLPPGDVEFRWRGPRRTNQWFSQYQLELDTAPDFSDPVLKAAGLTGNRLTLKTAEPRLWPTNAWIYWRVLSYGPYGMNASAEPATRFRINPDLPVHRTPPTATAKATQGQLVDAPLHGDPAPRLGQLESDPGCQAADGPDATPDRAVRLTGAHSKLVYTFDEFPDEDYTACLRVRVDQFPEGRIGQIVSAWTAGMDDPLRLTVDQGQVSARLEAGRAFATRGVPLETNRWYHLAAVKAGRSLRLIIDGAERGAVEVPEFLSTTTRALALGGNPRYSGDESLAAAFADFTLYDRALSPDELRVLARFRGAYAP